MKRRDAGPEAFDVFQRRWRASLDERNPHRRGGGSAPVESGGELPAWTSRPQEEPDTFADLGRPLDEVHGDLRDLAPPDELADVPLPTADVEERLVARQQLAELRASIASKLAPPPATDGAPRREVARPPGARVPTARLAPSPSPAPAPPPPASPPPRRAPSPPPAPAVVEHPIVEPEIEPDRPVQPAARLTAAATERLPIYRLFASLGTAMRTCGLLVLAFVVYQIWGTGFHESRAQASMARDFEVASAQHSDDLAAVDPVNPSAAEPAAPPADEGEVVARIEIPSLDVTKYVVEGVSVADLKRGPGHFPGTPLPGEPGNAAIAGHRTTYGAPFLRLNKLEAGDPIIVTTVAGVFRYLVTERQIVEPSATYVLANEGDNRLTLTTCHPVYSAGKRMIVTAVLDGEPARPRALGAAPIPLTPATTVTAPRPHPGIGEVEITTTTAAPTTTSTTAVPELEPSPESLGLSGDATAWPPVLLWGAVLMGLWAALKRFVPRGNRRLVARCVASPFLLFLLIRVFEDVNRLFPGNL